MFRILKLILFFLISFFLMSCSKDTEEQVDEAIESANIALTKRDCETAIWELETLGRRPKNARYLIALASAYACKANYSSTSFYGTNLSKIASGLTGFLGSLSTFNSSLMTSPDDSTYTNLQTAIDILLNAGSISSPTAANRALVFSNVDAQDINIFALYLILTQIGKFVFYYGNADPTNGIKGGGSVANGNPNRLTNGCFYDYAFSDPAGTLQTAVDTLRSSNGLGSCTDTATGHVRLLALPNTSTVSRLCQGIVLFNQFLDVLTNVTIPSSGKELANLTSTFSDVCTNIAELGDICNVKTLSDCTTDFGASPATDQLQFYFFSIYEKLFI